MTTPKDDQTTAKEIRDFQDNVRDLLLDELETRNIEGDIDGGGCDSGDWRDFTLSEIRQGFSRLADHYYELEEARGWVSVTERMPQDRVTVMIFSQKRIHFAFWNAPYGNWAEGSGLTWAQHQVTHWQALPNPPEPTP